MKILANQKIIIEHKLAGSFKATAHKDFDTDLVKFYPITNKETIIIDNKTWQPNEVFSFDKNLILSCVRMKPKGECKYGN